MLVLFL